MSGAGVFSAVLLGISLVVSAIKLLDWWISTDPKSLIQTGRWLTLALTAASVAGVAALLVNRQWTPAMTLGAGILFAASMINWRALNPLRSRFRPLWSQMGAPPAASERAGFRRSADPELVARAAAILENYLIETRARSGDISVDPRHPGMSKRPGPDTLRNGHMSEEEACEILDLHPQASAGDVRDAHRRLMQLTHPDRGGSKYLAGKVNEAKDVLLRRSVRD